MTQNQKYQYKNEKEQQKQQQQYNQHHHSSGSSSTTIHTEPGVLPLEVIKMQLEQLVPIYEQLFGSRGIPAAIRQYFGRLIRAGMEPAVIASAINATAWARFPTPYYMRAILQRYMAEGIMTEAQLDHDRLERAESHNASNAEREEWLYF